MRKWANAIIILFTLIPGLAWAEIYYWVDDQGIQYYTTRLENIPEPYRSKAQLLSLPTSPPAPPELQSTPSPKAGVKIPFDPEAPVLVSAKINGAGPITLILDTGADRTLILLSALQRLGISMEKSVQVGVRGVTGKSYGEAVWVNSVVVGEAMVGPLLLFSHDTDLLLALCLLVRYFLEYLYLILYSL
jgi:hypothetical protein